MDFENAYTSLLGGDSTITLSGDTRVRDQAGARAMLEFLGSAEANAVYRELNMETVP